MKYFEFLEDKSSNGFVIYLPKVKKYFLLVVHRLNKTKTILECRYEALTRRSVRFLVTVLNLFATSINQRYVYGDEFLVSFHLADTELYLRTGM